MVTSLTQKPVGHDSEFEHRIELAPNCALTPRDAALFVGSLALVVFAVALVFACRGLWPVLPFAGLEVGLLTWAVRASLRRGAERELIVVSEAAVVVERRRAGGSLRTVFTRHWATVKLRDPRRSALPSRLTIESHGRVCEVGHFLTDEERRGLAERLQRLVGRTSESPALAP
jgi:uncharacterized membrane protein